MAMNEHHITTVLMTADTVGGVWTYCMDLIRDMAARNVHFHLVTAGGYLNDAQRTDVDELSNVTLHETNFRLEWMPDPWNDIDFSGWQLLELERKYKPDIIHLNSYSYASVPFRAPVVVAAHSDVFSWWYSVKKSMPDATWYKYFTKVKDGLRNADCVVSPSRAMMDMLTAIYGQPADARIIHNGRCRKFFSAKEKQPFIMCAGRFWDDAKNLSLVDAAAPNINSKIRVAGEVGDAAGHIFSKNIEFLGRLSRQELAAQLAVCAIYVAPARYEPFGLSILEAALSGCALVLGNISSLREIWKDSALYVNVDDAHSLEDICNALIENPLLAATYGTKAKQRAKLFSIEKKGKAYYQLYRELAANKVNFQKMQTA